MYTALVELPQQQELSCSLKGHRKTSIAPEDVLGACILVEIQNCIELGVLVSGRADLEGLVESSIFSRIGSMSIWEAIQVAICFVVKGWPELLAPVARSSMLMTSLREAVGSSEYRLVIFPIGSRIWRTCKAEVVLEACHFDLLELPFGRNPGGGNMQKGKINLQTASSMWRIISVLLLPIIMLLWMQ